MHRAAFFLFALCPALTVSTYAQDLRDDPRAADIVRAGALRIGVFPSFQYRLSFFGDALGEMKRSGSLQRMIAGADLRGVEIVQP